MILTDNFESYQRLQLMSYDGRRRDALWAEQNISEIGYHYYMPPETAQLGLERLPAAIETSEKARIWSSKDYPYLPDMQVFQS
jgi:dTDP-4-amino-4,6-dideoxygalactose transaminase